jgi:DNA-binding CsgD family transcriptional regulator
MMPYRVCLAEAARLKTRTAEFAVLGTTGFRDVWSEDVIMHDAGMQLKPRLKLKERRRALAGDPTQALAQATQACLWVSGAQCPRSCAHGSETISHPGVHRADLPSESDLAVWARLTLHAHLPHRAALFGMGTVHLTGLVVDRVIRSNLAETYVQSLSTPGRELRSPALHLWNQHRAPLLLEWPALGGIQDALWRANFERAGFRNCLVDGLLAPLEGRFTFLALFDLEGALARCPRAVRELATLPAHEAWLASAGQGQGGAKNANALRLSKAESELLEHLNLGKTNAEIAKSLKKSAATVKTQLELLYRKTGAKNRAQLVAKTLAQGAGPVPASMQGGCLEFSW